MLLGLCLLLPLGSWGHRYPPVPYHPIHPYFPPLPPDPPPGAYPPLPPPPLRAGGAGSPDGQPQPPAPRPTMPHRPPQWNAVIGHQRPMDDMVDITNELGVAVLQDYAYSRGNFAFSPYGVVSVLVVLYEGARGETARQVHTTLKLPWDRDALRVGFRDVHRNLRSYFTHEGYLSGVTLSQSKSALIPEFRRVLRFYGYDVDSPPEGFNYTEPAVSVTSEQISSQKGTGSNGTASVGASTTASTTTSAADSTTISAAASTMINAAASTTDSTATSTAASTTTSTTASTTTSTTASTTTSAAASTTASTEPSTITNTPLSSTTLAGPEGEPSSTTTAAADAENEVEKEAERLSTDPPLSLLSPSLLQIKFPGILMGSRLQEQLNSLFPEGLPEARGDDLELQPATTSQPEEREEAADPEPSSESESIETTESTTRPSETTQWSTQPTEWTTTQPPNTAADSEPVTEMELVTESRDDPDTSPEPESETTTASVPEVTTAYVPEATTASVTEATTASVPETTTASVPEATTASVPEVTTASVPEATTASVPEVTTEATTTTPSPAPAVLQRRARLPGPALSFWTGLEAASAYNASKTRFRRDLNGGFPDLSLQLQNGMFDSHVATGDELFRQLPKQPFLVDGAFEEPVPVMEYTASFPFAYIPRLHALAMEFPLDDERYRLLLLLPVERQGLRQLLHSLGRVPLRDVQRALRPTRVHAVVPAFMVEGFVILTPTLQQLGIWDMFDPRRADLSGMTDDPDLYVRNIEQAVTVVVKNYVEILDIQTRTTAARSRLDQFVATHPFLYFVMDAETQVSLMAGKVVDPLNSRIY